MSLHQNNISPSFAISNYFVSLQEFERKYHPEMNIYEINKYEVEYKDFIYCRFDENALVES